jgi:sensor c-di-GMP phosphodiesterase-like protein
MRHYTKGCREVMEIGDFMEDEYRIIESWMMEHSPDQVRNLVWKKDPGGDHEAAWFDPFFKTGYVPRIAHLQSPISMDDDFWMVYDYLSEFVDDDFWVTDMELIYEMSRDRDRFFQAVAKSKPNIRYVFKVFSGSFKAAPVTNAPPEEFRGRKHSGVNKKWEPNDGSA